MAVSGLDIFKLTPRTNCKECGFATCMAFAMKVATGAVEIGKCPHISQDAKDELSESTAPPMKEITVGSGDNARKLGAETVMFRHEKTLVNKNLFAVEFSDEMSEEEVNAKIEKTNKIDYDRIGEQMNVEVFALRYTGNKDNLIALVNKAAESGKIAMIVCDDAEVAKAALAPVSGKGAVLVGANADNYEAMTAAAKEAGAVLGVSGTTLEEIHDTVEKIEKLGYKNLFINTTGSSIKDTFENTVQVRRTCLKNTDRTFGYPSVVFANQAAKGNKYMQLALAATYVIKYGSIIVLDEMDYSMALPLFGLRQNIFTDPQKPMRVEPKVYELNNPGDDAPVIVTVDFALTYFIVSGEVERSKKPVFLAIPDAGGYSVLTAWAAGKFSGSVIANFIKENNIEAVAKTKKMIIPGKVAVLKGDIEDQLPGWEIIVGPNEAMQLPKFLKEL